MKLSLIVLYVADLEASHRFYELLGLDLVREQHGAGPVHYAAELPDGCVVELYPAPAGGPVTKVRLGFAVPDPAAVVERLRRAGLTVKRQTSAVDPDGNRVQLSGGPWDGFGDLPAWMCEEPDEEEQARIRALLADPDRVVVTGVEYAEDSPQGRAIAASRAAAEQRVLRPWVRGDDAGSAGERRELALRRMQMWVAARLGGKE